MLPKQIYEPQWNSTARDATRERGRSAAARRRSSGLLTLVAIVTPLALLTALGLLAYQRAWFSNLARGATTDAKLLDAVPASGADDAEPAAPGQRAAVDHEMCYKTEGWAFLGQYSIKLYDPASHLIFRANFALDGETCCRDARSFAHWAAAHHCLLREQIMVAVRESQLADLMEPKLERLQNRLVTQVNRMVGEPFLTSVRFKGFCLYQSSDNASFVLWEESSRGAEPEDEEGEEEEEEPPASPEAEP